MEEIRITFTSVEGECRRLIGLIEQKGGQLRSINMSEESNGTVSRLLVLYSSQRGTAQNAALINKIRGMHGVVAVTSGDCS